MVTVTCYGGVREVGGNQILVEDGERRLLLDFGTPYARWNCFYEEYLKPRPGAGLLDVLELGLLPPLRGLYREDLEFPQGMWERFRGRAAFRDLSDSSVAGVLVSHAHLDHSGYVSFLRSDIPVYATVATAFIAKAMQDVAGGGEFEREVAYFSPRQEKEDHLSSQERGARYQRPFALLNVPELSERAMQFWEGRVHKAKGEFRWEEMPRAGDTSFSPTRVGDFPLRFYPVDHSIPGACAFAVETSAGWIGYTGDLRLHGLRGKQTEAFVQVLKELHPCALLCEGTRSGEGQGPGEEEVFRRCLKAVQEAEGRLVIADFTPRNLERLACFLEIARATGRRLAVLGKDAYLLEHLRLVDSSVPSLETSPHLAIYCDPKDTMHTWEQELRERYQERLVSAQDVRRKAGDFILSFSFWDVKNLIDIEPYGARYIYSSSEAHNEEQRIDLERLRQWVGHFQMCFVGDPEREKGFHSSGHASGEELVVLIKEVRPRMLIPIHGENPGFFVQRLRDSDVTVVLPQKDHPLEVRT